MLEKKVAIVTGGTRGIGREIVLMLAREGADVAFTYLKSGQEAEKLVNEVKGLGRRCLGVAVDVRDFEKAKEFIEKVKNELDGLDILINNAGITKDKAIMLTAKEDWRDVIDTNLGGVYNMTRNAIITFLKQKSGNIVNMTSISGIIGMARQTNYAASKAGVIGFTKSLAREVSAYNIRVNAVAPGFIDTDMTAGLVEKYKGEIEKSIPLGRLGTVTDVAQAVRFLLSDSADFITGQVIIVDGGLSLQL